MKIKIKVNLDKQKIAKIQNAMDKALEMTADAIISDIIRRGVTPKDNGDLERDHFTEKVKEFVYRINNSRPYARRWYFNIEGVTFQKTKNPNAQDHWMDYYLDGEGLQFVIDTYTKFFKELTDV